MRILKQALVRTSYWGLTAVAILVLSGCGAGEKARQERLANGIPVIFKSMPGSRVATVLMQVRAGSVNETESNQGVSRLLERCLFRKSDRFPQIRETIESFGGEFFSGVNQDFMSFFATAEASYLKDLLLIFSDALQSSRIDSGLVESMKRNLLKVMEEEHSNPRVMVLNRFLGLAFQQHLYRFLPLGNPGTLKTIRTDEVVRYYESLFTRENVQFIVTGAFDPKEVINTFNGSLRTFARSSASTPARPLEPEQTAPREVVAHYPFPRNVAFVAVGWKAPSIRNPDTYSVDVLVSCLGMGEGSRLNTQIRNRLSSVYSIWAEYYTPREPGYLLITSVCRPDAVPVVQKRILDEIEVLKKDEITPTELERAKMSLESIKAYSDEGSAGTAGFIGYWSIQDDVDFANSYSDRIEAVTAREVRLAASQYLKSSNYSSIVLLPEKMPGKSMP